MDTFAEHLSMAMGSDWTIGLRVWVERRAGLFSARGGSNSWRPSSVGTASRRRPAVGMSYRRAWLLVQSINQAARRPLVLTATGGHQGGGARLTPQGRYAVAVFRELQERLRQPPTTSGPASSRARERPVCTSRRRSVSKKR